MYCEEYKFCKLLVTSTESDVKTEAVQQNDTREESSFFHLDPSLHPHLALSLLVTSKELSDLIQKTRVLLPAAQAKGGLSGAA